MRRRSCARWLAAGLALWAGTRAHAGPYTEPGHPASAVQTWASEVDDVDRGPIDIGDPLSPDASHGEPEDAFGPPTANSLDVFSLGDGGHVTFFFADGIADGVGDDLAVFENGFFAPGGFFGEFAFVEVSSNGSDFARFPAVSLQPTPVPGGGVVDPTDYHNLAGKHPITQGTGFDLAELALHPLVAQGKLDLGDVAYVRIVDVIGNGSTVDSGGRPVYDPFTTPFASGGFDVAAVGAPEPGRIAQLAAGAFAVLALSGRRRTCARRR